MRFLLLLFTLAPLTGILYLAWWITGKRIFGKMIGFLWLGMLGLFLIGIMISLLTAKMELDKEDYQGDYIVNRDYFPGKQADWQYNHFRFTISENDAIHFHVTEEEKILRTYRGTISTTKAYNSERLIINMEQPTHHILASNPTTYRSAWSFYLVFNSAHFHNVYFKKGQWKALAE